jgi:hypothetical protein
MDFSLDHRKGFLCVPQDKRVGIVTAAGPVRVRKRFPIREGEEQEVAAIMGQPPRLLDERIGLYVDESGESYRLLHGEETGQSKWRLLDLTSSAD